MTPYLEVFQRGFTYYFYNAKRFIRKLCKEAIPKAGKKPSKGGLNGTNIYIYILNDLLQPK